MSTDRVPGADPGLINADLAPTAPSERTWSVLNMAALWDRHGGLRADLHAGGRPGRAGHELVAGGPDDLPRQSHRAGADDPERARGYEVRYSLPGSGAGELRHPRRQHSGPAARSGGLRVVRHPDLDRRFGDPPTAGRGDRGGAGRAGSAAAGDQHRRGGLFSGLLGDPRSRSCGAGSTRSGCSKAGPRPSSSSWGSLCWPGRGDEPTASGRCSRRPPSSAPGARGKGDSWPPSFLP